jgi:SAM-dependent methyltransferase
MSTSSALAREESRKQNPGKSEKLREYLISGHDAECPYFVNSETSEWVGVFWDDSSMFRSLFETLDLACVVDLACGQGRHTAQFVERAGRVTLVDANAQNIEVCRKRFAERANVSFVVNSGYDLRDIDSGSQSALFSYDAMVHFEPEDMISYIFEISRVLKPGGRALLHYSNTDGNWRSYLDHPDWRNFFSENMMRAFAWRAGLVVEESKVFPWGTCASDALTLLRKDGA